MRAGPAKSSLPYPTQVTLSPENVHTEACTKSKAAVSQSILIGSFSSFPTTETKPTDTKGKKESS